MLVLQLVVVLILSTWATPFTITTQLEEVKHGNLHAVATSQHL